MLQESAKDKSKKGERVKVTYSGVGFVQRWTLHILPNGFTRSRFYGGWSNTRRKTYQGDSNKLSTKPTLKQAPKNSQGLVDEPELQAPAMKCPKCKSEMELETSTYRPRWSELFYGKHGHSWQRNDWSG